MQIERLAWWKIVVAGLLFFGPSVAFYVVGERFIGTPKMIPSEGGAAYVQHGNKVFRVSPFGTKQVYP